MWGRFDDLRAGTAVLCPPPYEVLVADRPQDVRPVLAAVERATSEGAWAYGYLSYEAASGLDASLPVATTGQDGLPLVWFGLCAEPDQVAPVGPPPAGPRGYVAGRWRSDWSREQHRMAVERVREHIADGDTYQCNLTVPLRTTVTGDLLELYADLVHNQQAAHAAYLDLGRHVVASASPELFFEWAGDRLLTRPMKGTARRGRTGAEDRRQAGALLTSDKERAENTIVVDLLRNDLSRVARTGTVSVPVLRALERYETVWQLTSDVTGTLRPECGLTELLTALFPCGSVTGAPKRRTMEIISSVESGPRGIYCGAVGLVAPPSAAVRARFSVAIRTAVVDRDTGEAVYGTGGGITWGSVPDDEYDEMQAKAAILVAPFEEFGLVETLRYEPETGLRNLERHLARLADSADYFGYPLDHRRITAGLQQAATGPEVLRVRLQVDRSGAVTIRSAAAPPGTGTVRLEVDGEPVDAGERWLYHKTTRRDTYTTRSARHPDADDVVLVNRDGAPTETTIANLAVRLDGTWWTPPVEVGCLPGVERGRLVDLGHLVERVLTVADLHRAQGLALVSSLRGWRPAVLGGSARVDRPASSSSGPEPAGDVSL